MTFRETVCLARHKYHLIEWWSDVHPDAAQPPKNTWTCKWCRVRFLPTSMYPGCKLPIVFVRMNGPIGLWDIRKW